MNEQFCSYEIAVKLKELGFNEPCLAYYYGEGELIACQVNNRDGVFVPYSVQREDDSATAPLWQQAIDWFEKEHRLILVIYQNDVDETYFKKDKEIPHNYILSFRMLKYDTKNKKLLSRLIVDGFGWTHKEIVKKFIIEAIELCKKN
jgi:hypothetical protein